MIDVRDLTFAYGNHEVLHEVSLQMPPRAVTAFIGPSGCGKTTLLRCFNRMNDLVDALAEFAGSPIGRKYPQAVKVWEDAWEAFTPFLAFSPPVRKLLYTTNSIESLNYQLRKVTKARGHFPSDDAVVKLLWLAIINIEDKRARERAARRQETGKRSDQPARLIEGQRVMGWREALNELAVAYPGRIR